MKWSILAVWSAVTFGLGLTAFGQSNPLENTQPPKLTIDRAALSGPFGFRSGMSREQIVQAVGKENVAAIDSDALGGVTMFVSTAPKPHAAFTDYVLDVSPERGLLRIEAFSRSIDTSEDGSELSSHSGPSSSNC